MAKTFTAELISVAVLVYTYFNKERFSVRLYLQLFVEWRMSYLRYLCLFVYSGVQHICSSSVPHVASFSGLSYFARPFGIL